MTDRHPRVPTARLGWGLIPQHRLRYAINVAIWASMWVMPVIPAIITRVFFDSVTGDTTNAPSMPVLVAIILAYAIGRITVDDRRACGTTSI